MKGYPVVVSDRPISCCLLRLSNKVETLLVIVYSTCSLRTTPRLSPVGVINQIFEHIFTLAKTRPCLYRKCVSPLLYVGFLLIISIGFLQEGRMMRQRKTLRERIEARIARKKRDNVFLPREFGDLGGEDQVLRVLRGLVREGRLVRLGYGVYGRAIQSRLSGEPILYSPNGFIGAARQALTKLGVQWDPTEAERAYNEGRSTQIPVNPVVRVKGRFSRQLRYGNTELVLER